MTPTEARINVLKLAAELPREYENAMKRVLRRARTVAAGKIRSRGIGRALWGKGRSTATLSLKVERVKRSGTTLSGGLEAKGVAAMIDQGGMTKPHVIKPKNGTVLALKLPGGRAFARAVRHPGSRIPAQPFMKTAQAAVESDLPKELDVANVRAIARAGLA